MQAQQKRLPLFSTNSSVKNLLNTQALVLLNSKFKEFVIASFPTQALSNFLQQNKNIENEFQLALGKDNFNLKLQTVQLVSSNYRFTIQEPTGMRTINEVPENIFYKGYANNDRANIVRLTLKDGLVSGFIQQDGKEIFVESLTNYIPNADPNDVIIYNTVDVILNENSNCGVTERATMLNRANTERLQGTGIAQGTDAMICKKLKFVFITDYSMYQYFNGDVVAMQNKLLATLNNAQGVYTALNFGTDTTVDVGTDELNFEMTNFHVSSCAKCDVINENEIFLQGSSIATIRRWARTYADTTSPIVTYYWTRKQMYLVNTINTAIVGIMFDGFSNCTPTRWALIGCMYRPDDGYLRQVTAHELGHAFGCYHDDAVSPSVNSYIMYSSVSPSVSKLSSLTDFPGILLFGKPYSSKLTIGNAIRKLSTCMEDCSSLTCEVIDNISVSNFLNSYSILVKWTGSNTTYSIKVREKSILNTPYIVSQTTNEKRFVLNGLQRCTFYTVEVQNSCGNKSSFTFSTSSIKVSDPKVIHERTDLHDVEVNVSEAVNFLQDSLRITVDHITKWNKQASLPQKIILKDLFSDGARHRIDVYQGSGANCRATVFYTAPYYRKDATVLANADFNDCKLSTGWKDSIIYRGGLTPFIFTPYWSYRKSFERISVIPAGTIDSSCMILYNNELPSTKDCLGSILLCSPSINLNYFGNKKLSFDYVYSLRINNNNKRATFKVEGFNGEKWVLLFNALPTKPLPQSTVNTFWDTIPVRKFISLDTFINTDFKVRFIVDDSSYNILASNSLFVALDNIKIDGYAINESVKTSIVQLFPIPTKNELFVKVDLQAESPVGYRILDATGRLFESKQLLNYRINVEKLPAAVYFIQFYFKSKQQIESFKFIKN